ncbi:MAG TPA: murein biosynthesis integral membrane protein MurJ [Chondromyces sp.]|nr:murein biosynthesis integral membrane protein MurJ [Chondromyces sp.]
MKKVAVLLMLITIFTKLFGFARDITLSYFYGASNITDAYLISITVPTIVFAFIGTGIATSYIPIYNNILKEKGVQPASVFTNNIINFTMVICTVVIIFVSIFTEPIVKLFASGFEGETLEIAVSFTRINIFGIYFSGLIYVYTGYLQVKNNFLIPALMGIPLNILTIVFIVLSKEIDIMLLAIGSVIAIGCQMLFLIPSLYKSGYRYKFILNKNNKYLQQMIRLSIPVIIGVSVTEINTLIDRTMASQIAEGGISALSYANKLTSFVQGIFVISISTIMYPIISRMASDNNIAGLKKSVSEAVNSINLLVLPATVYTIIFAEQLVRLSFGRGAFGSEAMSMTSVSLFFYSIGMIGFGLREVLSRVFYSIQDTKTPVVNASVGMIINIALNIILSKYMGIGGLALATSISATFITVLLLISLRKKIGSLGMKSIFVTFLKILFASSLMGLIAKLTFNGLIGVTNQNLSLLVSFTVGALFYLIIVYLMKIEDIHLIIKAIKRKMGVFSK